MVNVATPVSTSTLVSTKSSFCEAKCLVTKGMGTLLPLVEMKLAVLLDSAVTNILLYQLTNRDEWKEEQ